MMLSIERKPSFLQSKTPAFDLVKSEPEQIVIPTSDA
jgi:hypothetical protein